MDQSEVNRLDRPEGSILKRIFPRPDLTPPRQASAPPIHRGSMVPEPWVGVRAGLKLAFAGKSAPAPEDGSGLSLI